MYMSTYIHDMHTFMNSMVLLESIDNFLLFHERSNQEACTYVTYRDTYTDAYIDT